MIVREPDPSAAAEVAEGGLRTASVVAMSPMRLIAVFKRDVWTLDRRRRSRLSACEQWLTSIARKTLSALAKQRAQDEHGGSPGSDPLAGGA